MKEKTLSLNLNIPVSAVTQSDSDTAARNSVVIVDLSTGTFSTIFVGNYPLLLPEVVKVVNHIANMGTIEVRFVNQNGSILSAAKTISPGTIGEFTILPSLQDYYLIQARAVNIAGGYGINISLADEGADYQILELSASSWATAYVLNVPDKDGKTVKITNHPYSSGSLIVRLSYEDGGLVQPATTLAPGQEVTIPNPCVPELVGDVVLVQMKAAQTSGTYFFSLVQN